MIEPLEYKIATTAHGTLLEADITFIAVLSKVNELITAHNALEQAYQGHFHIQTSPPQLPQNNPLIKPGNLIALQSPDKEVA